MSTDSLTEFLEETRAALPLGLDRWIRLLDDCVRAVRAGRSDVALDDDALRGYALADLADFRAHLHGAAVKRLSQLSTNEALLLSDWLAELVSRVSAHGEEALSLSERRFRVAIDRSNIAAFETDLIGYFTWLYNSKLPKAMGRDMIGTRIDDIMDPEVAATLEQARKDVLAGSHAAMDVTLRMGGEEFHRLFSFGLVQDETGEPLAFGGSSVDTTAIKRAQAELRRAVSFREQLMGILSHDLRNPLAAVRGITNLLQLEDDLPSKVDEGLARIDQSARRMSEMIETILDFTRLRFSEGGLPVARDDMDMGELCRDVMDEALAGHQGRRVALETSGDLFGRWDRPRMAQVLSNLLGNALTHGDEKEPVRLVAAANCTAVTVDVVNRGPTIPAEKIGTLFEPFVRGEESKHGRRRHGLGLGLYIAKQIVSSHGGTLTAQSLEGTTTFRIVLPRLE
jgi:signal transduction histidine kinase